MTTGISAPPIEAVRCHPRRPAMAATPTRAWTANCEGGGGNQLFGRSWRPAMAAAPTRPTVRRGGQGDVWRRQRLRRNQSFGWSRGGKSSRGRPALISHSHFPQCSLCSAAPPSIFSKGPLVVRRGRGSHIPHFPHTPHTLGLLILRKSEMGSRPLYPTVPTLSPLPSHLGAAGGEEEIGGVSTGGGHANVEQILACRVWGCRVWGLGFRFIGCRMWG